MKEVQVGDHVPMYHKLIIQSLPSTAKMLNGFIPVVDQLLKAAKELKIASAKAAKAAAAAKHAVAGMSNTKGDLELVASGIVTSKIGIPGESTLGPIGLSEEHIGATRKENQPFSVSPPSSQVKGPKGKRGLFKKAHPKHVEVIEMEIGLDPSEGVGDGHGKGKLGKAGSDSKGSIPNSKETLKLKAKVKGLEPTLKESKESLSKIKGTPGSKEESPGIKGKGKIIIPKGAKKDKEPLPKSNEVVKDGKDMPKGVKKEPLPKSSNEVAKDGKDIPKGAKKENDPLPKSNEVAKDGKDLPKEVIKDGNPLPKNSQGAKDGKDLPKGIKKDSKKDLPNSGKAGGKDGKGSKKLIKKTKKNSEDPSPKSGVADGLLKGTKKHNEDVSPKSGEVAKAGKVGKKPKGSEREDDESQEIAISDGDISPEIGTSMKPETDGKESKDSEQDKKDENKGAKTLEGAGRRPRESIIAGKWKISKIVESNEFKPGSKNGKSAKEDEKEPKNRSHSRPKKKKKKKQAGQDYRYLGGVRDRRSRDKHGTVSQHTE